ncbi:hypothetical protein PHYC_00528 [Phycisphaerales bacterium]|nr:hypothetical protein PHYC_00528 [Phycisphaerales bacterium]
MGEVESVVRAEPSQVGSSDSLPPGRAFLPGRISEAGVSGDFYRPGPAASVRATPGSASGLSDMESIPISASHAAKSE